MKPTKLQKIKNKYYIKYYMIKAGNDNPKLKTQLAVLEKLIANCKLNLS